MINPKKKGPCKRDCPDRTISPNCHDPSKCEKWAKHLEECAKYEAARNKFKNDNGQYIGYLREDKAKRERKSRYKR